MTLVHDDQSRGDDSVAQLERSCVRMDATSFNDAQRAESPPCSVLRAGVSPRLRSEVELPSDLEEPRLLPFRLVAGAARRSISPAPHVSSPHSACPM
jgi:hypothetical protein